MIPIYKKLLITGVTVTLVGFGLMGCGKPTVSDKDQAIQVVKQFLDTQGKVTYKDPASYQAGDKYMKPELAKSFNQERSGMYKFFTDNKVTISGSPETVTFIKQEANNYIIEGKKTLTLHSDKNNSTVGTTTIDNDFTVSKEGNNSFLISNIKNHGVQ